MDKTLLLTAIIQQDIPAITRIYNSNPQFLQTHLGVLSVGEPFVQSELNLMQAEGFVTLLLQEPVSGDRVGFCDLQVSETAYLSLLMLDGMYRGMGLGTLAYNTVENYCRAAGARVVRIDVVDNYQGNVVGFWQKQGFVQTDRVELVWGGSKLPAQVMRKEFC